MPVKSKVSDISVIEVHQTQLRLKYLETNKSVYPGDIPTTLTVKCAHYLGVPLTAICNQCFVDGMFPVCFLTSYYIKYTEKQDPKSFL